MPGLWYECIYGDQCICTGSCQSPFEISSPETDITREGAMQAFMALRAQARENGVSDMSLDDINKEIDLARKEVSECMAQGDDEPEQTRWWPIL